MKIPIEIDTDDIANGARDMDYEDLIALIVSLDEMYGEAGFTQTLINKLLASLFYEVDISVVGAPGECPRIQTKERDPRFDHGWK